MGRSRWRNRGRLANSGQRPGNQRVTINVGLAPVVPEHARPGLDHNVILALQELDRLMKDMRLDLSRMPASDEEGAVFQSLVYLSVLLDVCLADIVMSAMISNDVAVRMKLRLLLEYSAKGYYYDLHPDYALFMVAIQRLRDMMEKAKNRGASRDEIFTMKNELTENEERFARVLHLERKTFGRIMHDVTRDQHDKRNDEYVLLYQTPSSLIHGDPEGMHYIQDPKQTTFAPMIEFPVEKVNAMLVDAGNNSVIFCATFVRRFHPSNEAFSLRIRGLERSFKALALKHTYDRPPHIVSAIQAELLAEDGGPAGAQQG